jgi:hypothetical protein
VTLLILLVLPMKDSIISNIMTQYNPLLVNSIQELFSIALPSASNLQHMYDAVSPLPKYLAQYDTDILVQQEGDLSH